LARELRAMFVPIHSQLKKSKAKNRVRVTKCRL